MIDKNYYIKEKVRTYVFQASHAEKDIITDDSHIFREGYFDSIGLILMVSFIEEEFNFLIDETDIKEKNLMSINAITAFIYKKIGSRCCVENMG